MKKAAKLKKDIWFIALRGSYLPTSWQGWLSYIPYTVFLLVGFYPVVVVFIIADTASFGTFLLSLFFALMFSVPIEYVLVKLMTNFAKRHAN